MAHSMTRALLALATIVALVWGSGPAAAQDQPKPGGTLIVVTPSDISTLDPHRGHGRSKPVHSSTIEATEGQRGSACD